MKETDEVPDNWGIMEINEKSKIKVLKKSKKNPSDNPEKFENFGEFIEFDDKLIERCLMLCKSENELDIIERQMKYNIEYYKKQIEKLQKLQENLLNVPVIK